MKKEKELAIELHKLFCRSHHTDQCFWYYATDESDWTKNYARNKYLNMAKYIQNKIVLSRDSIKIVKLLREALYLE